MSRSRVPAAVRRSAYVERCAQRGLERVPSAVPSGFQLASVEPMSFPIGGQLVRVTWSDVARHAARAAPVAGVVVLSSVYASAMVTGPCGPVMCNVFSNRPRDVLMSEGSMLELAAYKHGTVRLYPFLGDMAERVREGMALLGDASEHLPEPVLSPLPAKLVEPIRWHV